MEKVLVVVVDSEAKAYEASRALQEIDREGNISVYAAAVIQRNADGTITKKHSATDFPVREIGGMAIGALIGLLGGPIGAGVGAVLGGLTGGFSDLDRAEVGAEFIDDVSATLTPGKFAVIADVSETWVTPVDVRMEALGGTVLRSPKKSVEAEHRARENARARAEIAQYKAEMAQASADRKAKLQARIDKLNARLEAQRAQAKQRSEQMKFEADAKIQALKNRAKEARADVRSNLKAEATRIRQVYQNSDKRLRHLIAGQLRGAAVKLEKEEPQPVHQ
jgi:uncharacterized membrane protein